jgi:hypothetical protein
MSWAFSTASVTRFSGFIRGTPPIDSENGFKRLQFHLVERPAVGTVQARLYPAREGSLSPVPGIVPGRARRRPPGRTSHVFRRPRPPREHQSLQGISGAAAQDRLGGLARTVMSCCRRTCSTYCAPGGRWRPQGWLFPGRDPAQPMTTRQLNRACHAAAQLAEINKCLAAYLAPQLTAGVIQGKHAPHPAAEWPRVRSWSKLQRIMTSSISGQPERIRVLRL